MSFFLRRGRKGKSERRMERRMKKKKKWDEPIIISNEEFKLIYINAQSSKVNYPLILIVHLDYVPMCTMCLLVCVYVCAATEWRTESQ